MRRWLFAAAVLAGLLAASRLSNAWGIAVPAALVLASSERRGRSVAVAAAGLAPGALLVVVWLLSNLAASGVAVPSRLAGALQVRIAGSLATTGPTGWRAIATELLLGQGKAVQWGDAAVLGILAGGLVLTVSWNAWLAARSWSERRRPREACGTASTRFARVAVAAAALGPAALAANALLVACAGRMMPGVFQPLGRYFLAPACFGVALIGAWTALGGPACPQGVTSQPASARGSLTRAAVAAGLALALAAVWLAPGRFTPPRWGSSEVRGSTPLAAVFGLPRR